MFSNSALLFHRFLSVFLNSQVHVISFSVFKIVNKNGGLYGFYKKLPIILNISQSSTILNLYRKFTSTQIIHFF